MAAVILLVAFILALTLFGPVLEILLVALLLAIILSYPIRALARRRRLSYTQATALVSVVYLSLGTLVLALAVVPTIRFVVDLVGAAVPFIEGLVSSLGARAPEEGLLANPAIAEAIANLEYLAEPLGAIAGAAVAFVGGIVAAIGNLVGVALIASVVAITFLFEAPAVLRSLVGAFPPSHRREIRILMVSMYDVWKRYFRATILCGATIGALTLVQLLLMGIPGAFLIGLFAAVVSVVPIVGGFIALVPIGLAPLLYGSTVLEMDRLSLALLTVAINLVLQFIMWNVLDAIIVGRTVNISVTMTIVLVAVGAEVGGMIGAYIAVPITVIASDVASYVVKKIHGGDPYPGVPEPHFVSGDSNAAPPPGARR